jgi:type IV pilus assembly protein PilA
MLTRLRHRVQGQEGFTLIELLVVILIIGILAAVAIPAFLNQKGKANDANVKSDANTAQTAEETYFTDSQTYVGAPTAAGTYQAAMTAIEPTLTQAFKTVATGGDTMVLEAPATGVDGATLTGPAATAANSFDVQVTSKSGVSYAIIRNPDGTVQRVCNVPANTNPAGCTPASGSTGNGTW